MKKTIVTTISLTFFILQCFSQNDFRIGYVILNNNDTIFGLINYRSNYENTLKCVFRKDIHSQMTTYFPDDIKAYRLEDSKYFVSKKINASDTTNIFLEFLFEGIVKLYDYFDKRGVHYLISKNDSELVELKNDTRTTYVNNVRYETESKEYIGVLKNIFRDSPTTIKNADETSLNLNPLIDISEGYHKEVCPSEECITYAKKKIYIKLSLGLIAGVNLSGISITETRNIVDRFILPSNGTGIILGTVINVMDPFFSRRLSIQSEITLAYDKYSTDLSSFDLMTLHIPLQVKYSLPLKSFQVSALAGIGFNNILIFDYVSIDYGKYSYLSGRGQMCLLGGLEFSYNLKSKSSALLQLKYEYDNGTKHKGHWSDSRTTAGEIDYSVFDMKIPRIVLLFGYIF